VGPGRCKARPSNRVMRSRRRSRYWHDPERLQGQAERDAQLGRTEFYVYVLDTDYGDYVGHSWHVGRRLKQHQAGEVKSTEGSSPTLLWVSRPFSTREDAARFEASLKSLRDQCSDRYREMEVLKVEVIQRSTTERLQPEPALMER